jgi:hypothetical protein
MAAPSTRLKIRLATVKAIKSPELFGQAEWVFRVSVDGIERWRSDKEVRVREGEAVPGEGGFALDLAPGTDMLVLEVTGTEKDRLNPDDHAYGSTTLFRSTGFGRESGFAVDLSGQDAELRLYFVVRVEEIEAKAE